MPRIFVAVPVATPVRAALSRLRRHPAPGLRWVAEHQFHITLKFLGDTSEADVETVPARGGAGCAFRVCGRRLFPAGSQRP